MPPFLIQNPQMCEEKGQRHVSDGKNRSKGTNPADFMQVHASVSK